MHTHSALVSHPACRAALIGLLLSSASLAAASEIDSAIHTQGRDSEAPAKGIPYFLPKPILLVRTSPEIDAKGKVTGIKVEVEKQIVADRSQRFRLRPNHGVFTAATASFEVEDGLLTSVNGSTESKFGDALQSVASFVFSLKTIPALKQQLGAVSSYREGLEMVPPESDPTKPAPEDPPEVKTFRENIAASPYHPAIKAIVAMAPADEIDPLLKSLPQEISGDPQPVTFEQLVAEVDPETLKRSEDYPNVLSTQPTATIGLGGRLQLRVEVDFGDDAATSTFDPPSRRRPGFSERAYADQILVRGERPVTIKLTLMPDKARTTELLLAGLQAELKDRISILKDRSFEDQACWELAQTELKAAARAAAVAAAEARKNHSAQLQAWLTNESALSDGRGHFAVAVLPLLSAAKTAEIAELVDDAKDALATAQVLGTSFSDFRKTLLSLLIEIEHLKSGNAVFSPDWAFSSQRVVTTFPSPEAYQIPLERLAMGKSTSALKLSRGVIRSFSVTRDAPAAEIAALPAKLVEPYFNLLKDLISIKVKTLESSKDAITQEIAIRKLEEELRAMNQKPDAVQEAHDHAIADLTRARDILTLQQAVLELQESTKGVDPLQAAQSAINTSIEQQTQIAAVEEAIARLP